MERRSVSLFLAAVLWAAASGQKQQEYFAVGGKLVLRPASVSEVIKSVVWKFNGDLLAEWVEELVDLKYYKGIENRANLNTITGVLEISNMSKADVGLYSVEINYKVQSLDYDAVAIMAVSQTEVIVKPVACSQASDNCTLSCHGDFKEAEPVTFFWKEGDGEWQQSERDRDINNNEDIRRVKTFSCRVKNPVSEAESEPFSNPFIPEEKPVSSPTGLVVGVIAGIFLIAVAIGIWYWKKKHPGNTTPDPQTRPTSSSNDKSSELAPLQDGKKASPDSA